MSKVFFERVPEKAKTTAEAGVEVNWGGQYLVGIGSYIPGAVRTLIPKPGR